ncbi:uncharacterized protein LOC142632529 [Castanea sativa]|uniref:uncharacterized protein LOC142632529 n=1 Tax=Castanea sativa TaxID=21020 RepID=UPI003F652C9F
MIRGGGITRLKYHLARISGDVEACKKVSEDVKWQMKRLLEDLRKVKRKKRRISKQIANPYDLEEDDDHHHHDEGNNDNERGGSKSHSSVSNYNTKGKEKVGERSNIKSFFTPRTTPGFQPSIKSSLALKQMVEKARMNFASWWYHVNIPFLASRFVYYQEAIDGIAAIGPGFKGPSYHDLRGSLLQKHVCEMNNYLFDVKNDWKVYGCSIMSDGWTNQRNTPIINFLVYCPRGTMFLKSLDVSGLTRDTYTLFKLFDKIVQEVGVEHIVQFVTDNDSAYKSVGKKLMQKYGSFYWSPCAAHCIDLMLENFSDRRYFPIIHKTIQKAKRITKFIYNHGKVLSLMRSDVTNGRDLIRLTITRFATEFLSLQCLIKFKKEVRQMFTCDQWVESRYARDVMGKEVAALVLEDKKFWLQCQQIMKISEPLVRVLRLVDGMKNHQWDTFAWWEQFGNNTLELQKFAIQELSQCCSATGCERAWSTFEFIHSKRRNRVEHKRLNNLVFVRYNLLLREMNIRRTKDYLDPINLDNIDLMEDWIAEESEFLLLTEEDVNWASIE